MPSLSELPSNLSREKLTKSLARLGFIISKKGGKGSHIKATFVRTQKSITIQKNINKNILYYLLKEIEKISNIRWEHIKRKL